MGRAMENANLWMVWRVIWAKLAERGTCGGQAAESSTASVRFRCAGREAVHPLDSQPGVLLTFGNRLLGLGAATGLNLEEGSSVQSEADYLTKVSIACKEAHETL